MRPFAQVSEIKNAVFYKLTYVLFDQYKNSTLNFSLGFCGIQLVLQKPISESFVKLLLYPKIFSLATFTTSYIFNAVLLYELDSPLPELQGSVRKFSDV